MNGFKLKSLFTGLAAVIILSVIQVSTAAEYVDGIEIDEESDAIIQESYMLEEDAIATSPEVMWGATKYIAKTISPFEFHGLRDAEYGHTATAGFIRQSGTDTYFDAGIDLPTGAMFYGVTTWIYDGITNGYVQLLIYEAELSSSASELKLHDVSTTDSWNGGLWAGYSELNETGPITIKSTEYLGPHYFYRMRLRISDISSSLGFRGVTLFYKLQISPAPATATFNDVPTGHFFFKEIEALAASGITQGCGSGNFCPQDNVTREQMAAFLSRALGLHYGY